MGIPSATEISEVTWKRSSINIMASLLKRVVFSPTSYRYGASASLSVKMTAMLNNRFMTSESKGESSAEKQKSTDESAQKLEPAGNKAYQSGEMLYSYNIYSFYDIENDMADSRLRQPSSLPKVGA